ncbi:UDP-N-acetylmuramate dehydrogenase [Breznakiella homolactica]|uniref:UDP-N-acetylenolpyruvoylglucosamine reductase n=2 Tax=Breznakiella homolactica TaxID=2798577 RepID=A0A7T8BB24_9SPIR|nr:UDP-N-acetylmuramate dehydrogenase [Breznakiella homolactica]
MARHTTFKVGGLADLWIRPGRDGFPEYTGCLLRAARDAGVPVFILGGGANIVVSDRGIRGIVLDTGAWTGCSYDDRGVRILSGTPADAAAEETAGKNLGGLEFLAGMPGSIGGAVWMNARCYEKSVSDILTETEILGGDYLPRWVTANPGDFAYKLSPFQRMDTVILSARFALEKQSGELLRETAAARRADRESKGQYRFPSAGSAFKNNRDFGKPTGKIVDELGLKGLRRGGAQVAPWHGNFIINTGGATAADIRGLVEEIREKTAAAAGFILEPEILFVGDWG